MNLNLKSVLQFDDALVRGDVASALSLLENGRVTIRSVYVCEEDGVQLSYPLIFLAVGYAVEEVSRALMRQGAGIDTFRNDEDGDSVTPACDAIVESNVQSLSLCLKLGADLSCVHRTEKSPRNICSALEMALKGARHEPLVFLLDKVYTSRPIRLIPKQLAALVTMASSGSPAKVCYETLVTRGFDFSVLNVEGELPTSEENGGGPRTVSDLMLSFAQKSGAADLVRYLVKDLRLASTAGRLEELVDSMDKKSDESGDPVTPRRADMTKYTCAVCEFVGATEFCSGCKVPRYCSKKCQRAHWKTGGHKQECKNIQRLMRSKEATKEGSSGAAGSSKS